MSRLLTLHQVAERLGIHYQTAHKWIKAGKLPPPSVRVGHQHGYLRWYESVIEDWLAGRWQPRAFPPGSPPAFHGGLNHGSHGEHG